MLTKTEKERIKKIENLVYEKQKIENILRTKLIFSCFVTREMSLLDVSKFNIIKVMKIKRDLRKNFKQRLKDITQNLLSYQIER